MGLTQLHEEEEKRFQERWFPGTSQTDRQSKHADEAGHASS